ncbi:MAG TPA: GNAT family N-acetyltransferase [Propionibacteriaceae bacterium]|nr:GNAT family N-acetyltransferase [Propionibacteriaceae bacterium]
MTTSPDSPTADSVRLALPGEAEAIAHLQRRAWMESLPAVAAAELAALPIDQVVDAWTQAITRPPRASYRVLVAVEQRRVVGLATTVPSDDPDADVDGDGRIDEFAIDPAARRRGHGSRLLHACVDTLRADGFRRATWWVASTDDVLRGFLLDAGWAADGARREIGTEDDSLRMKQIRLHTDITSG